MNLKDKGKRISAPKNQSHIKLTRDPSKPDWSGVPGKDPPSETQPKRASAPKSSTGKARS